MNKIFIPIIYAFRFLTNSVVMASSGNNLKKDRMDVGGGGGQLHILLKIQGTGGKQNDILFYGAPACTKHVLFFPGDVQDYLMSMEANRDNRKWHKWNLEATASLLGKRFPDSYIWVIRPSRKFADGFSCFDNFVEGDTIGTPKYSKNMTAILHLKALLQNAVEHVNAELGNPASQFTKRYSRAANKRSGDSLESDCDEFCSPSIQAQLPVVIAGFSKGCIVMNQMLYELENARQDEQAVEFLRRWTDLYWLDGGHSGTKDTWITDEDVLKDLAGLDVDIHIHMSPYQRRNPQKPWTGEEQRVFADRLIGLGARVTEKHHFEDKGVSLKGHFEVLAVF